jgi:hypothetical protein
MINLLLICSLTVLSLGFTKTTPKFSKGTTGTVMHSKMFDSSGIKNFVSPPSKKNIESFSFFPDLESSDSDDEKANESLAFNAKFLKLRGNESNVLNFEKVTPAATLSSPEISESDSEYETEKVYEFREWYPPDFWRSKCSEDKDRVFKTDVTVSDFTVTMIESGKCFFKEP